MRSNKQDVGEVLRDMVRELRLGARLTQSEIRALWQRELGPVINRHTSELRFRNGVLTVKVTSAPLRHELLFNRVQLAERLNKELTNGEIREIQVR